jgi:uncharacterized membrane protein YgcG
MANLRWLLAIPIALAAMVLATPVQAATIRDGAGMFSPGVVKTLKAELDRIERATKIPVVIETINAIPGLEKNTSDAERRTAIDSLAIKNDKAIRDEGIYILISKREHLISRVLIRERYDALLPHEKRDAIRAALVQGFKAKDFDGGLTHAVDLIEQSLNKGTVVNRGAKVPGVLPRQAEGGQSTMGTFLWILLAIVGVFIVLRILGGLLSRSAQSGYPGQMGGMGMQRPGMGPGPGYYGGGGGYGGGRGGGFFSSLMGGIGGAVAGNWLYDQFSGRHGNTQSADTYSHDPGAGVPDQGGDAIIGADDDPGGGASWDDAGGGNDAGGGDWGGGGGDWGGGGGDWGGGGGDGGGGGGDW